MYLPPWWERIPPSFLYLSSADRRLWKLNPLFLLFFKTGYCPAYQACLDYDLRTFRTLLTQVLCKSLKQGNFAYSLFDLRYSFQG